MWLMLQQPSPDDYVLASGETHSMREFVELAFGARGPPVDSVDKLKFLTWPLFTPPSGPILLRR